MVRHLIAMRIRELKVRAQDVGDRRHRSEVTVPPASADPYGGDIEPSGILGQMGRPALAQLGLGMIRPGPI